MADEITAVYHFGDREVEQKYSIKRYVEKTLDSATAKPQSKVLAQAIANYGHYAQVYLSGYRGWTMGVDHAEMAAYGQPNTGADLSSFTTTVTNRHSYITRLSRQLGLDADTTLYILMDVDSAAHPDALHIAVRDEYGNPAEANVTRLADGRYQVAIPNISAHKLGMKYSIVVDDTMVIETSVLSYAASTLTSTTSGAIMKKVLGFSSGMMINRADFWAQNFSASISVSKHRSCSSSESRKELSLDKAVDITDAMLCSAVFRAAPANHFALCSSGRS